MKNETDWNDYEKINKNLKKKKLPFRFYKSLNNLEQNFLDTLELIEITDESNNPELFVELQEELKQQKKK